MNNLHDLIDQINQDFTVKTDVRDKTLKRSRELIGHCANTIRAIHRHDEAKTAELMTAAKTVAAEMVSEARQFPDIYHAGYTQDALKELAEASITEALIMNKPVPTPAALNIENAAYINGMAETVGELRRYALDALRRGEVNTSERMLEMMDEIYTGLITVDFQ